MIGDPIGETADLLVDLTRAAETMPAEQRLAALVGLAQASATLALAEEQRTANLIALLAITAANTLPAVAGFHVADVARAINDRMTSPEGSDS